MDAVVKTITHHCIGTPTVESVSRRARIFNLIWHALLAVYRADYVSCQELLSEANVECLIAVNGAAS